MLNLTRLLTLRTSFAFMLLLLAIASVIAGHPFQALAENTARDVAHQNERRVASSAPSLRLSQMYMHEPRDRTITPAVMAVIVGGISFIVAGLMA
ncbi:hypothetical protein Q9L58_003276 [Maublancomyces gigas]|uniref:Transmembrane protein n=1 Tax=Discina gigas TaxID=1032678 RepID=A0ABR3GP65_9PEZI